jgi:hypothetical protein
MKPSFAPTRNTHNRALRTVTKLRENHRLVVSTSHLVVSISLSHDHHDMLDE